MYTPPVLPRARLIALAVWPSLAYVAAFAALYVSGLDLMVAQFFYDPASGGFPLRHQFWTSAVLHDGARSGLVALAVVMFVARLAAWPLRTLRPWQRPLGIMLVTILVSLLLVHEIKQFTNVDCPWDTAGLGGTQPHLMLFDAKPATLERGVCFPGGHSSGGFALLALYFAGWRRPRWTLALPGLAVGSVFAVDQWVRGAHFPSHDLTTAWLCWMVALATYTAFHYRALTARTAPD